MQNNSTKLTDRQDIETNHQKNFVALFRMGYAIGPEDWEVSTQTKLCNEQTTIGEIFNWFKIKMGDIVKFHCEIVEAE